MNLHAALAEHRDLKAELLAAYPELVADETTLNDTLDGISSLDEAIAAVIRSAEEDRALCEALSARMDDMKARLERLKARVERKREAVADIMEQAGKRKVVADDLTITLSNRPAKVVVNDEAQIPDEFLTVPPLPDPKPDKRAILAALKEGRAVAGCSLSNARPTVTVRCD
jgi:seryl-tRNA synthetase